MLADEFLSYQKGKNPNAAKFYCNAVKLEHSTSNK